MGDSVVYRLGVIAKWALLWRVSPFTAWNEGVTVEAFVESLV